jgi:DNA-binding NarL/FixJ family response regulator
MRVVIADDSLIAREGIVRLLAASGVDVVAQCADADELLRAVETTTPDAAVVDIRMPPTYTDEGLVAAQTLRAAHPDLGVLVLSQHLDAGYALRLVEESPGGVGYLLKERVSDIGAVVDALARVVAGETVVEPAIVAELLGRLRRGDPLGTLTGREREVLGLVAEGFSNRAIATHLFVVERTVEAHVTSIFLKLGLADSGGHHRRVLAVLAYLRRG